MRKTDAFQVMEVLGDAKRWRAALLGQSCVLLIAAVLSLTMLPLQAFADDISDQLASGNYVEGEVVAAFRADGNQIRAQANAPYDVTTLMAVSSSTADGGGLTAQSTGELLLSSVASDTLSTEELLRLLADDPDVAFAEPNYLWTIDDADQWGVGSGYALEAQEGAPYGDLTPLQWGNWSGDGVIRAVNTAVNPSINVPAFGSAERGANMDKQIVVALLDTGVNYQHPDLANIIYHFTPEQQETLGCWAYGYTALGRGTRGNVEDVESSAHGHGTHTAGIIGAEWNGFGTSGVASNVKIVSITLANGAGAESLADAVSAFAFVDRFNELAPEEERIRVTSNSWSEEASSRSVDAAIRELGDKWGIVSCFSSANDGRDNDHHQKTPSTSVDNPYVIVVGNTSAGDALSRTSNFGHTTVDLAAPGTAILSTMPQDKGTYLPDATRESDPLYLGFDGGDEPVYKVIQLSREGEGELWESQAVDGASPEGIGSVTSDAYVGGTNSLRIDFDPQYKASGVSRRYPDEYDLQLEIDLAGTGAADLLEGMEGLHLGMALACGEGCTGVAAVSCATNLATGTIDDKSQLGLSGFVETSDVLWDFVDRELEVQATRPAEDKLVVRLRVAFPEGYSTLYIDSLGLGAQLAPYGFATGTSMSTPAVSGAAAVLASQGYKGKELAALVRSKVRIPDAGPLSVRSGGVFDFTVEGSPDVPGEEALAPVIDEVAVDGSVVTVTGSNFGTTPGGASLFRYVVGEEDQNLSASIVSWSDEKVVLEATGTIEGILKVVLANAAGKFDTRQRFVNKGANVFEQDLPFDSSTGETFVFDDSLGDWETKGPLVGLGCKLYYLPSISGYSDEEYAHRRLLCFDLKKQEWSELAELPEWLQKVSAVMYEGKLVVKGATMRLLDSGAPTSDFPEGTSAEERVYVYDPSDGSWSSASTEGMRIEQTIVNDNGSLMLVGGGESDPAEPWVLIAYPAVSYDLVNGAGEALFDLPAAYTNPQVAVKDGTILIYNDTTGNVSLTRVRNGEAELLDSALPEFFVTSEEESTAVVFGTVGQYPYRAVVAPCDEGFVLVGPPAKGGPSDTFILRDGSDAFEPYALRSSEDRVYGQAVCTYRGRLFVIGSAWFEPGQRLFRATAMGVPEYPGDVPCDPDPDPDPEPEPTPTPDVNPTPATKPSSGTKSAASATSSKRLPKTGDTTAPVAVLLCVGIAAVIAGLVTRRTARD